MENTNFSLKDCNVQNVKWDLNQSAGGICSVQNVKRTIKKCDEKMRYSLKRAIYHEFWLRMNLNVNAPKLILKDCKRLRDYWKSKLTDTEKKRLDKAVAVLLSKTNRGMKILKQWEKEGYTILEVENPTFLDVGAWDYDNAEPIVYVNVALARAEGVAVHDVVDHEIREHKEFLKLLLKKGKGADELKDKRFFKLVKQAHKNVGR